jgi:UDPglucose 6-dehydrogenase
MKITIVGTGYVGLVTGTCLADTGHHVTCVDIDVDRVAMLQTGESPIFEPGLNELIERNVALDRLSFTTDANTAYNDAEAIFICVGTPDSGDGTPDLSGVLSVTTAIADAAARHEDDVLVIVKSTVPVGTTAAVAARLRQTLGDRVSVANNPEFLREGDAINDFTRPDRVVCGTHDDAAKAIVNEIYAPYLRQGHPLIMVDPRSSEMIKYAANAMLASRISFINEMAMLCQAMGADIEAVRHGLASDHRIGGQFLHAGLGYGGSCFPKDVSAVIDMARKAGLPGTLAAAIDEVNQYQREAFLGRIHDRLGADLSNMTIAIWGLAFKPRTDDVREAPAATIATALIDAGASVTGYDPEAGKAFAAATADISIAASAWDAATDADALIICTEWREFRAVDLSRLHTVMKTPIIFDGRNLYNPQKMRDLSFEYYSIGRCDVVPSSPEPPLLA